MREFFFPGRPGDPRLGGWSKSITGPGDLPIDKTHTLITISGSPDDTGVRLNHGRAGAHQGPDLIRKHLYRMTPPVDLLWEKSIQLYDAGNIRVTNDIRKTHENARLAIADITKRSNIVIALGGGHDFAAPHFIGFIDGIRARGGKPPRAGLINVDPHLDVRELENGIPNSGTPFREILDSQCISPRNLIQFGFRRNRNARTHLEYCKRLKVGLMPFESLQNRPVVNQFKLALNKLVQRCSVVGLTIDMDSCYEAEGVSAAPVIGFSARELYQIAEVAGLNKKVHYLEIAEVAPPLDPSERSARIAAEIIYAFLVAKA